MLESLFMTVMFITALFLIVLVLVQRGKGGGLAGAFGGMGGQSAFGTKAGDLFTRITIGVATFWIVICVVTVKFLGGAGGGGDDLIDVNMGGASRPAVEMSVPLDGEDNPNSIPAAGDEPARQENPALP